MLVVQAVREINRGPQAGENTDGYGGVEGTGQKSKAFGWKDLSNSLLNADTTKVTKVCGSDDLHSGFRIHLVCLLVCPYGLYQTF